MLGLLSLGDDVIERIMECCHIVCGPGVTASWCRLILQPWELGIDQILQMTSKRISICNRNYMCAHWTALNGHYEEDGAWVPGNYYEYACGNYLKKTYNSEVKLIRVELVKCPAPPAIWRMLWKFKEGNPSAKFPDFTWGRNAEYQLHGMFY